jgi:hypothetical protein
VFKTGKVIDIIGRRNGDPQHLGDALYWLIQVHVLGREELHSSGKFSTENQKLLSFASSQASYLHAFHHLILSWGFDFIYTMA